MVVHAGPALFENGVMTGIAQEQPGFMIVQPDMRCADSGRAEQAFVSGPYVDKYILSSGAMGGTEAM